MFDLKQRNPFLGFLNDCRFLMVNWMDMAVMNGNEAFC